jgi:hypothetical protein
MQTAYPARRILSDVVKMIRERAEARGVAERRRTILRRNAELLESAFKTFEDHDETRQHELVAIMWACFHVGMNYPGLANDLKARTEAARNSNAQHDKEARELGLEYFDEAREAEPRWRGSPMRRKIKLRIAEVVAPRVVTEMKRRGHSKYSVAPPTVLRWVSDRERAGSRRT